ncbi:MAG: hypothetical protein QXF75_06880 [Candidatus Bathyarchaeia archaeon]
MNMRKTAVLLTIFVMFFIIVYTAKVQGQEDIETFFDSKIPGITIQVNATSQIQSNNNITFVISLAPETPAKEIEITSLIFHIYGFVNGTIKSEIYNKTFSDISLSNVWKHNDTIFIPQQVYGAIYGEVNLTYIVKETFTIDNKKITIESFYPNTIIGFSMTRVENVYLKMLEDEINRLKQEKESLSGIQNELNNTRTVVAILGVTTVLFLATTAYLVFRRPKTYW